MKNFFHKFAPLEKVDVVKREVTGVIAEEAVDKANEIFDYATSKDYIQKWSESFEKATEGRSLGNVRAQHSSIAAGKLLTINFDDAAKKISVTAKIVDDNEWKKVDEGVYTGFSIGGRYVKRWADGQYQRYTASPAEVSIVDNPCMHGALFTAIKADGSQEMRKFVGGEKEVKKSMWDIGRLSCVLEDLDWMREALECEREYEGDASDIPDKLKAWIAAGVPILKELVDEETRELSGELSGKSIKENEMDLKKFEDQLAEQGKQIADLVKMSAEQKAHVQAVLVHHQGMGEHLGAIAGKAEGDKSSTSEKFVSIGKSADGVEIFKRFDGAAPPNALEQRVSATEENVAKILDIVSKLAAQPAPAKAVVTGATDGTRQEHQIGTRSQRNAGRFETNGVTKDDTADLEMQKALANGKPITYQTVSA